METMIHLCPSNDKGAMVPTILKPQHANGQGGAIACRSCVGAWIRFAWC